MRKLTLLECDRSFTRSDALAKHMRTVHETEALRPSDPVPRNYSSTHFKPQRLKLIINSKPPNASDPEIDDDATIYDNSDVDNADAAPFEYPSDIQFSAEEIAMPPDELYRQLRREVRWSEQDGIELQNEVKVLEAKEKEEWMAKELVLTNLMEAELAVAHRKGASQMTIEKHMQDLPLAPLPLSGTEVPWYRQFQGPDGSMPQI